MSATTPAAPNAATTTLYEHVGGEAGMRRLVEAWYPTVLADPLLRPLFGAGHADHVPHLTAFLAEVFGGPRRYTDELGGFAALLEHHRGLRIDEAQRGRFVALFLAAADDVGWPTDDRTRAALHAYLEFGTEVAVQNSHATADVELHPCQEVPRWDW
jgi:hemoglobin